MDKATGLNVTATLLAASGHVQYDAARIRVSPTIRWGQPDGSIKIGTPKNCRMFPHISFSTALKLTVDQYDKMLAEVLKASPESEALKPFVADQEKYHQWLDAKLTSSDAFIKRQEILKRIPQLKEARKAAVDQNWRTCFDSRISLIRRYLKRIVMLKKNACCIHFPSVDASALTSQHMVQ